MINYKDCIDLGFKRTEMNDAIFFEKNGYGWFLVTLKINKTLEFSWDSETKKAKMIRYDGSNILNVRIIENIETLRNILLFFTEKTPDSIEVLDSKTKVVNRNMFA